MSDQKKNAPRASGSEGINDMSDINDIIPQNPTDETDAVSAREVHLNYTLDDSDSRISQTIMDMISAIIKQRETLDKQLSDLVQGISCQIEIPSETVSDLRSQVASFLDHQNSQVQESLNALHEAYNSNLQALIHPDLETAREIYRKLTLYYEDVIAEDPDLENAPVFDRGFLLKAAEIARNSGEDIPKLLIEPQEYRTRKKATDADTLIGFPNRIPTITLRGYTHGLSFDARDPNGKAHLQMVRNADYLKYQGGKIFFEGFPASEAQLQNIKTKENIDSIDLPLLKMFYSIILHKAKMAADYENPPQNVTLHISELASHMGINVSQSGLHDRDIERIIDKTKSFHNIMGVIAERNGESSYYPVLVFLSYDATKATISFGSPYMNRLIAMVHRMSIRTTKDGKPKISKTGKVERYPHYSYMIHSSITRQKNKAAVENVYIIVQLIERAGNFTPNITARELIANNPGLEKRLQESAKPNQLLDRVFRATWKILREHTDLAETYKEISLPDPDDMKTIPTMNTLDMRFDFPHKGKKKDDPEPQGNNA